MRFPWANTILLLLLVLQLTSGFFGLINGFVDRAWILWTHGIGAYAITVLLFWKGAVVVNSLRRPRHPVARLVFLLLAALLVAVLGSGALWTFGGQRQVLQFSLLTFHIILALTLLVPLAWHVARMRFVFRVPRAKGRRNLLRLGALALAGAAIWRLGGYVRERFALPGARRRFTGSYETGSLTGQFPYVIWLADNHPPVAVEGWMLRVEGEVERPYTLTYAELAGLAGDRLTTVIDCTGGWYSEQEWEGVNVASLLERAVPRAGAVSVSFEAGSGYGRRFWLEEARGYLLALAVAGQVLDHGHGFPARLVAPDQRGFQWVKWVTRIQVHSTSKLLQPPVPLQ